MMTPQGIGCLCLALLLAAENIALTASRRQSHGATPHCMIWIRHLSNVTGLYDMDLRSSDVTGGNSLNLYLQGDCLSRRGWELKNTLKRPGSGRFRLLHQKR